jgi:hypothetical protein
MASSHDSASQRHAQSHDDEVSWNRGYQQRGQAAHENKRVNRSEPKPDPTQAASAARTDHGAVQPEAQQEGKALLHHVADRSIRADGHGAVFCVWRPLVLDIGEGHVALVAGLVLESKECVELGPGLEEQEGVEEREERHGHAHDGCLSTEIEPRRAFARRWRCGPRDGSLRIRDAEGAGEVEEQCSAWQQAR